VSESTIEVLLVPEDLELTVGDAQWGPQMWSLTRQLRSHDVFVRERSAPPTAGDKGAGSEIIVALGSSGAIAAAIGVVHGWLNQRSTRKVSLTIEEDGRKQVVELRADGLSDESARAALVEALRQRQIGGAAEAEPADGP
jgi:hypothetical protein